MTNAERIETATKLMKEVFGATLPKLEGTEKQISWATYIRADKLIKLDDSRMGEVLVWAMSKTDSSWWIERKDNLKGIVAEYMENRIENAKSANKKLDELNVFAN